METTTSFGQNSDTFEQRQFFVNFELAKLQMAQETETEKTMRSDRRKTIALVGGGIIVFLVIILAFMSWCLSIGKEQFVLDFLKYSLYLLSAGGGFWAGRISQHHHKELNLNPTQL